MAKRTEGNVYELLTSDPRRVYVIANAGLHHGGSGERALTLVRAAKWAGADAVTFQPFRAGCAVSSESAIPEPAKGQPKHRELPRKIELPLELPIEAFRVLHKEALRLGIEILSTPFNEESADLFHELGVHAFKLAPADIAQRSLLEHVSRKGKPMLLNTDMSSLEDIERAMEWAYTQSNDQVILIHCAPSPTAHPREQNMKSVGFLRDHFGVPVGFSDHTAGSVGSLVAASLGAQVIERHFMLENRADGPELAVSMDAKQLKAHIEDIRSIGAILGERPTLAAEAESHNRMFSRRSLYAGRPGVRDETIDAEMLYALHRAPEKSPHQTGLAAGKHALAAIAANTPSQKTLPGMRE